jgi:hypothetical protein
VGVWRKFFNQCMTYGAVMKICGGGGNACVRPQTPFRTTSTCASTSIPLREANCLFTHATHSGVSAHGSTRPAVSCLFRKAATDVPATQRAGILYLCPVQTMQSQAIIYNSR